MARTGSQLSADRIRIEDEVWENAFSSRVPSRPRRGSQTTPTISSAGGDAASPPVRASTGGPMRVVSAEEASPALSAEPTLAVTPTPSPEGPRTIRIDGRGGERHLRYTPDRYERRGFSPDRLAMWAVVLGFLLVAVAILSAHF